MNTDSLVAPEYSDSDMDFLERLDSGKDYSATGSDTDSHSDSRKDFAAHWDSDKDYSVKDSDTDFLAEAYYTDCLDKDYSVVVAIAASGFRKVAHIVADSDFRTAAADKEGRL